jgi:hypothetical protein
MGFKMRSGNSALAFKNMGSSSPAKQSLRKSENLGYKKGDLGGGNKEGGFGADIDQFTKKTDATDIGGSKILKVDAANAPKNTKKPKGTVRDNYGEGSEKTKRLKSKLTKKDKETESASVESEKAEAREGKYGKGLFKGWLRRGRAKGKHKRKGRQEDRTREKLTKSEAYDKLTPEQKAAQKADNKQKFQDATNRVAMTIHPNFDPSQVAEFDEMVGNRGSKNIEDEYKAAKTENLKQTNRTGAEAYAEAKAKANEMRASNSNTVDEDGKANLNSTKNGGIKKI